MARRPSDPFELGRQAYRENLEPVRDGEDILRFIAKYDAPPHLKPAALQLWYSRFRDGWNDERLHPNPPL